MFSFTNVKLRLKITDVKSQLKITFVKSRIQDQGHKISDSKSFLNSQWNPRALKSSKMAH